MLWMIAEPCQYTSFFPSVNIASSAHTMRYCIVRRSVKSHCAWRMCGGHLRKPGSAIAGRSLKELMSSKLRPRHEHRGCGTRGDHFGEREGRSGWHRLGDDGAPGENVVCNRAASGCGGQAAFLHVQFCPQLYRAMSTDESVSLCVCTVQSPGHQSIDGKR
jgi:hypothetical protein